MALTTGQRAAMYAVALFLVAVGGTNQAAQSAGFGPQASYILIISGLAGTAVITAYSLSTPPASQIEDMRKAVAKFDAEQHK